MAQVAHSASGVQSGSPAAINARIERLPGIPLGVVARALLAILYFFAFYDITVIGIALPEVAKDFHLTEGQLNAPVTVNLVGYVVGSFLFSTVADAFGRRRALALTLLTLSVGALLTAFSWDLTSLSIFRGIVGLGTGSIISIGSTYIAELVPGRLRGRVTQFNMVCAGLGLGSAGWIAMPLFDNSTSGWRILLGLGTLAALSAAIIKILPESPRWLAGNGREAEADETMRAMERVFESDRGEVAPPSIDPSALQPEAPRLPMLDLLRPPYLNRTLVVLAFWLAWYLSGYAVLGYEPVILSHFGLSTPNSQLFTAIGDSAFPVGALCTYFFIDRVDRRWAITIIASLFTVALVIFAIGSNNTMITIAAVLFAGTIVPGAASGYTYTSEIFPTNARASGMALGDGLGHIGGVFAPTMTLAVLPAWGGRGTFWLLAGIAAIGVAVIALGGARATTGRSVLEIAD